MLKSTIIPLPPLEEQRRLVVSIEEIMSRIGQARKLREEALKDTEAIMQSALHQIFSKAEEKRWSWKKLTDVCIRITDGTHKTPKYVEKGVPFLSVKNIKETGFVLDDVKYITLEEHLELTKRWKPQKGDVLYTKIGTTGIAKVVDIDLEFSIFVSVALLRPNRDMIDPYYLQTVLNSPIAREQAYKFTRGAANQNLVLKDLKKIEIPVPSLEEQKQIVMYTSKLQEKVLILKKYQEENKRKIEEITQAVLKEAFSGQL